jgi:hypothetical protein
MESDFVVQSNAPWPEVSSDSTCLSSSQLTDLLERSREQFKQVEPLDTLLLW